MLLRTVPAAALAVAPHSGQRSSVAFARGVLTVLVPLAVVADVPALRRRGRLTDGKSASRRSAIRQPMRPAQEPVVGAGADRGA